MNSKITNVLVFAAGAAIGSAVTWKVLKTKYDRLIQEEIDSVKEAFSDRFDSTPVSDEEPEEEEEEDSSEQARKINWSRLEDILDEEEDFTEAEKNEYEKIASNYTSAEGGVEDMDFTVKPPYVINPLDFGELDDYSQIELTYYLDGILEDDEYHIITDADDLIGPDALTTFGEYEEDSVYVRNERLCTDFLILKDYRTYDEAKSIRPKQVDD